MTNDALGTAKPWSLNRSVAPHWTPLSDQLLRPLFLGFLQLFAIMLRALFLRDQLQHLLICSRKPLAPQHQPRFRLLGLEEFLPKWVFVHGSSLSQIGGASVIDAATKARLVGMQKLQPADK